MPGKDPMHWRPKRPYSAEEILEKLKALCPSVAFGIDRKEDEGYRWDGDGPDPRDEGYVPYVVKVEAVVVVAGELWHEYDHLGGSYMKPNELDLDIHGYLPQMLYTVAENLSAQGVLPKELQSTMAYLKNVMKERYDRDQRRKNVDRGGG